MLVATLKSLWLEGLVVILLLIVCCYTSYQIGFNQALQTRENFGLGIVKNQTSASDTVPIIQNFNQSLAQTDSSDDSSLVPAQQENKILPTLMAPQSQELEIVYGSVNGTKFYNYGCKSGNRIKIENRVFFANQGEALLSGYEPASICDF